MKKIYNYFACFAMLSASVWAQVPAKYSSCNISVNRPSNASNHYFSKDCATLYVAPALKHKVAVDSVFFSASDAECQIIEGINKNFKNERKYLEKQLSYGRSSQFKKDKRELEGLIQNKMSYERELDTHTQNIEKITEKIDILKLEKQELEGRAVGLDVNSFEYYQLTRAMRKVEKNLDSWNAKLEKLGMYIGQIEAVVKSKARDILYLEQSIASKVKADESIYEEIRSLLERQAQDQTIAEYMKVPGAEVSLLLENSTASLINLYRAMNPLIKDIKMLDVNSNLKFTSNILTEVKLDAVVDGSSTGENISYNEGQVPFSNSLTVKVFVDKYTACTQGRFAIESDVSAVINANMYYDYDLQVNSSYSLEYNMSEVFKEIKKNTKDNGIFKSKSSSEIIKKLKKNNNFKVTFKTEDLSLELQKKEQDDIIDSFIDDALKQIGVSYFSYQTGTGMQIPGEIEAGATRAASRLEKKCSHQYCQYAALALNLGHDLFGGSEQSTKFISSQDFSVTKDYDNETVRKHFGSAGFSQW